MGGGIGGETNGTQLPTGATSTHHLAGPLLAGLCSHTPTAPQLSPARRLPCPALLPPLQVFERSWFARRRCLDVGCNEGVITLAVAARFHPASMLGCDIDGALIGKACR